MMADKAGTSRLTRVLRATAARASFYALIVASLLVFPAWLPWMVAAWIVAFGTQVARDRRGWPPLALGLVFVLFKRPDPAPALVALLVVMAGLVALDVLRARRAILTRTMYVAIALPLLIAGWAFFAWSWNDAARTSRRASLVADRPIVCMGDSLTAWGFPRVLAKQLSVPVIDHAKGGTTSGECLERVASMVAMRPQAVILEVGGHDYLRGVSRVETRRNLETIIRAAREAGAEVILFEVPRSFVSDPFWGLERGLAREHDLELIEDGAIRQVVIRGPFTPLGRWLGGELSYDGLHPNDAGNAFLAERVMSALRNVYGGSLR